MLNQTKQYGMEYVPGYSGGNLKFMVYYLQNIAVM